ncbi:Uncharacterized protein conserved in bacteria [Serratia fonticola]|uniref:Uncharacterized protein conserved in bacteria n=1 Tax=Serratia fonticola TaxID=47917 RepID=A0A4U9TTN6_SERFO|nr:Uncharacterized protein conserved in bacteria [Serratia fonticola]
MKRLSSRKPWARAMSQNPVQRLTIICNRCARSWFCDERTLEVARILLAAPPPSALARPFGALVMQAGIDLLPDWAQQQLGFTPGATRRRCVRIGVGGVGRVLRSSVRNGSYHRAMRRMNKSASAQC